MNLTHWAEPSGSNCTVQCLSLIHIFLTSLYVYRDCSAEEFYQYLIAFEEKHISGILLKEREQISEKEKKIKLLKTYCESKKIPLIEMPKKISFWEMISFVMNRIFTKDVARLRYFKLTQDNFNTLSFGRDITSSKTCLLYTSRCV